jgi:hypothetical protein
MKSSGIPWYVYLSLAAIFGAGGFLGKYRLDASAHPTYSVAIFTAIACLLALICFVKGLTRLLKRTAKD